MRTVQGFTLIELVVTLAIVALLASATMPLLQVSVQRTKESEFRANLRQIRDAIDAYKKAYDEGRVELKNIEKTGYPPNLEVLVEGIEDKLDPSKRKIKFLRKIPLDPMLSSEQIANAKDNPAETWGTRSYASSPDEPKAGDDVYDVYSLSQQVGTNGIPYAQW